MIVLITPTGARPKQMKLCAEFMHKQDYKGSVLWIIVDDALPVTTKCVPDDFKKNWQILKIYPQQKWQPGQNTQARNLLTASEIAKYYTSDCIFIIEDDDYYRSNYLSEMMLRLKDNALIGEIHTIYYNVKRNLWYQNKNVSHASLFEVAFTSQALPIFQRVCKQHVKFIDMRFFTLVKNSKLKINLFDIVPHLAIGIKGLSGRAGIGYGHKMGEGSYNLGKMIQDKQRDKLKILLGEDYKYYE